MKYDGVLLNPFALILLLHLSYLVGLGDKLAYLVGANFTPHVITVNPGEVCYKNIEKKALFHL